jgi:hypothetical protein
LSRKAETRVEIIKAKSLDKIFLEESKINESRINQSPFSKVSFTPPLGVGGLTNPKLTNILFEI